MGEEVGWLVEWERHVGPRDARVIGGCLDRGCGVEVAPHRLDLLRDLTGGTARSPLECHVLEQVRDAMLIRSLVATAGTDPDPNRTGPQMRPPSNHHTTPSPH